MRLLGQGVPTGVLFVVLVLAGGCGGGSSPDPASGSPGSGTGGGPLAVISLSTDRGTSPLTVGFDGRGSSDPSGGMLTYLWDFGGGETSSEPAGSVVFDEPGIFTVRLTVVNTSGLSDEAQAFVVVELPPGSPPPPPPPSDPEETLEHQVLYLTNLDRRRAGLPPLKGQSNLDAAAEAHAADMAAQDYFSHASLDGRTAWDRLDDAGYDFNFAGENIAAGYTTPEAAVEAWMQSAGHRQNILDADFRELGVGHALDAASTYGHYWVQDFGTRAGVFPVVIDGEAFATADADIDLYVYGAGWAQEMQVTERADFSGAAWQPYRSSLVWRLSAGAGLKTVHVRLRNGATERTAADEIVRR